MILADQAPQGGCLRAREWGFTTSDSDAVIRFSAVMYADGRAIADQDRTWLLWPAAQLRFAFAQAIE